MKKPIAPSSETVSSFNPKTDPLFKDVPELWEAIAHRFWDDGSPREPWTLSISCETGQPMVKVSDKWSSRTSQAVGDTVLKAMKELSEQIKNGTLAWRKWAGKNGK